MKMRRILAGLFAALSLLAPIATSAQSFGPSGQNVNLPALPSVATYGTGTLSTACATPQAPTTCAATSVAIYSVASGAASFAIQLDAVNSGTFAVYTSADGCASFGLSYVTNASNPSTPSNQNTSTSITAIGRYVGLTGGVQCVAIEATVAPSSAVTVTPYFSAVEAGTSLLSSIPLTVQGLSGGTQVATKTCDATTSTQCAAVTANGFQRTALCSNSANLCISTSTGVSLPIVGICTGNAAITTAATGVTQLVALVSLQKVYVCGYTLSATTTSGNPGVAFEYGTGTNCGTGATLMTGTMTFLVATPFVSQNTSPMFSTLASNALCISVSGTGTQVNGFVTYGQY